MRKVKFGIECVSNFFMTGKLFAVIGGQGDDPVSERCQECNDRLSDAVSGFAFDLADQRKLGFTSRQRDGCLFMIFAYDGIEFPVSETST